jgi:hypothetical protein
MALHPLSRSRVLFGLAVSVLLAGPFGIARAQALSDGFKALDDKWRSQRSFINQLLKGQAQADPNDRSHVEAIDLQARYNTYRVYLEPNLESQPSKIDRAFKDFEGDIAEINKNKPATQPLADIYRERVRVHALEVIQHDKAKPIHKIHNARILAKVAELGEGKLAETLCELIRDEPKAGDKDSTKKDGINDGVRYYGLRGLHTLLAQASPQQMQPLLSQEEKGKCAEAILQLLERKPNLPGKPTTDELDGYRLLRREAIRALAEIRTPAFSEKVRPALVLARIAGDDERTQPPPRIDERIEASIGLARMISAQSKNYQPDYAAGQIARCIGKLAQQAKEESETKEHTHPWKVLAARLNEALAALKNDSGKDRYVADVCNRATNLLQRVATGRAADAGDVTWFTTTASDPPSKELFKGEADTAVKPAGGEAPEK